MMCHLVERDTFFQITKTQDHDHQVVMSVNYRPGFSVVSLVLVSDVSCIVFNV